VKKKKDQTPIRANMQIKGKKGGLNLISLKQQKAKLNKDASYLTTISVENVESQPVSTKSQTYQAIKFLKPEEEVPKIVLHREGQGPQVEYQSTQSQDPLPLKKPTGSRIQLKKLAEDKRQIHATEAHHTIEPEETKQLNECSRVEEEQTQPSPEEEHKEKKSLNVLHQK